MSDIALWPQGAPGSEAVSLVEVCEERSPDTAVFQDRALSNIDRPRIVLFKPECPDGCSVLLAPGGGYQRVVWDKEGVEVARWLNSLGVTVGILVYRLPAEGHAKPELVPLQDAQRGLRLMRQYAAANGLDAARVGAMGFSAGGHVAASLATRFDEAVYLPRDAADALSARPDFLALGYPVISMQSAIAHAGSRERLLGPEPGAAAVDLASAELRARADGPQSFIFLPDDDAAVPPENGVNFYLALRRVGVPAELHVFRNGGHGFGIRLAVGPVREWTGLFERWLRHGGWLKAALT
ncbi:alpha/beta hydrolase [Viridibacterium curvum]|uniref:Alpha/beta hydrolase n=1 Tax=Viridibacterium curvum TaxID=1101404 RepID=A0ABP9QC92_9RHOO